MILDSDWSNIFVYKPDRSSLWLLIDWRGRAAVLFSTIWNSYDAKHLFTNHSILLNQGLYLLADGGPFMSLLTKTVRPQFLCSNRLIKIHKALKGPPWCI